MMPTFLTSAPLEFFHPFFFHLCIHWRKPVSSSEHLYANDIFVALQFILY